MNLSTLMYVAIRGTRPRLAANTDAHVKARVEMSPIL
jgi:hypothetical protein